MKSDTPVILFGAFDRHNFGDLLFPHLLAAMLPGRIVGFAGLAPRDLRAFGGHRVSPLDGRAAHLVHVGGELLTCTAWQAAVMLLDSGRAADAIARYDADPAAAAAWAARQLDLSRRMPYVVGRDALTPGGALIFNAVGGVEWAALDTAQRVELRAALAGADWLSVRDRLTRDALRAEGIEASLCPDPAVMVRACFAETIEARQRRGAPRAMQEAFPTGYLACQFSAEFGDDASLDALASGLARIHRETGLGVALFRAGSAPWHDDASCLERLARRLPSRAVRIFDSLNLWDICALIAASRGVVASSLHARIVALAYALPRVSLISPQQGARPGKTAAFAGTWEPAELPGSAEVGAVAPAFAQALAVPDDVLRDCATDLRAAYLESQAGWMHLLRPSDPGQ
ncbi:MAG TPA: polysaccharide pyruvyl transferase family protein [Thiobacillaceae bacterium]|nr:polysaccharide pyruvyl transferase family protein [Thiobacillaceae bacterium]